MNGIFNLLNTINYYKIIYNTSEYVFDIHPNISNYISFKDYMKKEEHLRIKTNNTDFYETIFRNKTEAKIVFDNLSKVEEMKDDKIIVYLNNLFILSIVMIFCAIILFFLRKYRRDWNQDMVPFYIVINFI